MSFPFPFPVEEEVARVLDSGLPASARNAGSGYTGPVAYWRGSRYGVVAWLDSSGGSYQLRDAIAELRPDGVWVHRGGGGCGLLHHPTDRAGERWQGRCVDWASGLTLEDEAAATIGWANQAVAWIEARVGDRPIARVGIGDSPFRAFVIGLEPPVDAELVALNRDSNPILRPDGSREAFIVSADPWSDANGHD
jgi:hypothetical protein